MEEKSIDYQNKKASYQELVELVKKFSRNTILVNNLLVDKQSLDQLESKFEDKLIYYIEWSKKLIIGNSITTKFVELHLDAFLKCFVEFDIKAHEMMNLMAINFSIDLDDPSQLYDLKRNKSKNQRGLINSEWDYHFHGTGCSFTNNNTGQFLDIKIIYGREYGVINHSCLFRFIQTTESLTSQLKLLSEKSYNLRKVMNVLMREEYLINRPNHNFEELILNRSQKRILKDKN